MPSRDKLAEFTSPCQKHATGDEDGQAQAFRDRLCRAFTWMSVLDATGPNPLEGTGIPT